ncbi:hypothetical protein WJX77_012202 [Trebouxia sp. C0004]
MFPLACCRPRNHVKNLWTFHLSVTKAVKSGLVATGTTECLWSASMKLECAVCAAAERQELKTSGVKTKPGAVSLKASSTSFGCDERRCPGHLDWNRFSNSLGLHKSY